MVARSLDLGLVAWLAVGAAATQVWGAPEVVLAPLGFVAALVLPGYALQAAIFPARGDVAGTERLVLTLGLSAALVSLMGIASSFAAWGVRGASFAVGLAAVTSLVALLASLRRARGGASLRVPGHVGTTARPMVVLAIVVSVTLVGLPRLAAALRPEVSATEFYVLGSDGTWHYPRGDDAGGPFKITLGIVNHDPRPQAYRIGLPLPTTNPPIEVPPLAAGERWERTIGIAAPGDGDQAVRWDFTLYRADSPLPHRTLHLTTRPFGDLAGAVAREPVGDDAAAARVELLAPSRENP